ncbi:MAG: DUF2892 domain-containing protein [Opitutaceae bacterium]|jgi:hypothetical protein|nr:DUF2892 domain-containing protein [Opitutaceae bacterium]
MKLNVGKIDTIVRVLLGIGLLGAGYHYESAWGLVGLLPLLTAALGFCPAYTLFGFSTCARQPADKPPAGRDQDR